MKIDGSNPNQSLIQQMQEAAQKEAASGTQPTFEVGEANQTASTAAPATSEPTLNTKVKETARLALDGKITDADEVRSRVIDAVIDDKLQNISNARKKKQVRETLQVGLVDNPAFIKEVDRMLLLAAQEVARGK